MNNEIKSVKEMRIDIADKLDSCINADYDFTMWYVLKDYISHFRENITPLAKCIVCN